MKIKRIISVLTVCIMLFTMSAAMSVSAFAADTQEEAVLEAEAAATETDADSKVLSSKAIAAAVTIAVVSAAGAIGMAIAIGKSVEGMARQPEASSKINSAMMLGLVFIETAIIYALIIAILIIFVL